MLKAACAASLAGAVAAAIYLCSRAGDYVVGETLTVDGGVVNALIPSVFNDPAG